MADGSIDNFLLSTKFDDGVRSEWRFNEKARHVETEAGPGSVYYLIVVTALTPDSYNTQ